MLLIAMLAAAQTQADMSDRAERAEQTADTAMNAQYARTMATMRKADALSSDRIPGVRRTGPSRANALLKAQRAWLAFRDAECDAEGMTFLGGSAHGTVVSECLAALTRQRTRQLATLGRR